MIVLDRQDDLRDRAYIGIQRPDKSYTYLHWKAKGMADSDRYRFTMFSAFLENYRDIHAIGPNALVDWSSEDEVGLC